MDRYFAIDVSYEVIWLKNANISQPALNALNHRLKQVIAQSSMKNTSKTRNRMDNKETTISNTTTSRIIKETIYDGPRRGGGKLL